MPVSRKLRRDKEMSAVTHNMKEDRVLEKSMQTLKLEQSYAMKLLQLDHRIVKVNYKRLKEKVSKIKSHLNADEITELKQLEVEGKLKPSSTVNIGSAIKIAGAAKRLKLQGPPRANTAVNLHSEKPSNETLSKSYTNYDLRRSNSVVGVFIDAPEPNTAKRRNSIDNGMTTIRPLSAFENGTKQDGMKQKNMKFNRPATSAALLPHTNNLSTPRINPAPTHSPYSSHSATEKEKAGLLVPQKSTLDKTSLISDDSIDSNLGEDLLEERRQEMLLEENARFSELEERKKEFLSMLDDYFKANPPPNWDTPPPVVRLPETEDGTSDGSRTGSAKRGMKHRLLPNRSALDRTFKNEEEYNAKVFELWKDLNKCRYLRIPDEMLDLSGVVTLAKDQMSLFQMLKRQESRQHLMRRQETRADLLRRQDTKPDLIHRQESRPELQTQM